MVYQYSKSQKAPTVRKQQAYSGKDLFYNEYLAKKRMRYEIRKKQASKTRFFLLFCIVFGVLLPIIFVNNINTLFLQKYKNRYIKVPNDISFLNTTESELADNIFLGERELDYVNQSSPLLKAPVLSDEMRNLTRELKNLASGYAGTTPGIFIWDYSNGKYVSINGDKIFSTASIIKIPILLHLYKRADSGFIDLNGSMSTTDTYISEGSGTLQYSPAGTTLTYRQLAEKMIQESDNTASNMLLSLTGGMSEMNRTLKNWGLSVTQFSNWLPDLEETNITTPMEMGRMLYNLDNPDFLSLNSRAEIVEIMGHVKNRNLIQAGLPDNVQFLHKTGDIGTMLGDAGIVILPDGRKYLIVIMVKRPWNDYSAKQFIIDASEKAYRYISGGIY